MTRVPVIETELGLERLCRGCGSWWPFDAEFWYFTARGVVMGRCRACWSERTIVDGRRQAFRPMVSENVDDSVRKNPDNAGVQASTTEVRT